MIKWGPQGGAQEHVDLWIRLFTFAFHGTTKVEEITQSPPTLLRVFPIAFVSRSSPLTLTLPCTWHPSKHPSCLNPGRRARFCEGCSSASSRIRMNASTPSHRRWHSASLPAPSVCCVRGHPLVFLHVFVTLSYTATLPGLGSVDKDVRSPALRPIGGRPDASPWKDLSAASAHSHRSLPFLMTGLCTCPINNHSLKPIPNSSYLKKINKHYFVVFQLLVLKHIISNL